MRPLARPVARRALTLVMLLLAGTAMSGCILEIPSPSLDLDKGIDRMPEDETGPWTYRDPTEKELLLSRSDFSVEIVRFTDVRHPRSMEVESRDQQIYTYDPDRLLNGVDTNLPGMLGKYLSYRPKMPKHYKVEIELKKLITTIKTGTLLSGHWGRYNVQITLNVVARRPDSTVALEKTYRLDEEQARTDYDGRGPTKERDRARMYDLSEETLRKMAESIGWDIRQQDARKWKAPAPQSIPTRLNLPPIDEARGTTEDDRAPLMPVAPTLVPGTPATDPFADKVSDAPVVVPSDIPADAPAPEIHLDGMRSDDATPRDSQFDGWIPDEQNDVNGRKTINYQDDQRPENYLNGPAPQDIDASPEGDAMGPVI